MKTTTKNTGIKVTTGLKAGGLNSRSNHSKRGLKVSAGLKAGSLIYAKNHTRNVAPIA